MLAWDVAVRGEHGGAREGAGRKPAVAADAPPHDPETGEINVSNIHVDKVPDRPAGTTAQAGLRRLEKAASAGDGNAADLLRRVVDPASPLPQPHPRRVPVRKLHAGCL